MFLARFNDVYGEWQTAEGDTLSEAYHNLCDGDELINIEEVTFWESVQVIVEPIKISKI